MSLSPVNQTILFSLDNYLLEFVDLYKKKRLPTKILLSGDKGLGKSTLAFHLVNYILSINEEHPYIIKESKLYDRQIKQMKMRKADGAGNFL